MEKKRVVPVWLSVILLLLAVASMVYFAYEAIRWISDIGFSAYVFQYFIGIVNAVLVLIYCIMGYSKSAAGVFKAFCVGMTIDYMITLYFSATSLGNEAYAGLVSTMFFAIMVQVGIWFVLTIAKDLGKKKTLCLCSVLILMQVLCVITMIPFGVSAALTVATGIVVLVIAFIMFYCKYADKAARGTK